MYNWKIRFIFLTLFLVPFIISAQKDDFSKMSLEEISRQMENPLSRLWSLTLQENLYVKTGSLVDGSDISNVLFFQPFMPFPVGAGKMLILRPVFPLVTNPYSNYDNGTPKQQYKTGFGDMQLITAFGPDKKAEQFGELGQHLCFQQQVMKY